MDRVIRNRLLAPATLLLLLASLVGCTDPWIVQGGIDMHDLRRPTAFVEGNTPLASWIGSNFGWQPVAPPHWQPVYAPDPEQALAEREARWVFRQPQQGPDEGQRIAQQRDANRATAQLPTPSAEAPSVQ